MDAGVLTFNNFTPNGLGAPATGFAAKGKGSHIKPLSVVPPDQHVHSLGTPRTSRGHLLAGLRTAPRSQGAPPSAPPTQTQHIFGGLNESRYADSNVRSKSRALPQTAVGSTFPHMQYQHQQPQQHQNRMHMSPQIYSVPEQVLGPPELPTMSPTSEDTLDPHIYADLVATNLYLAQQQRKLQEQLMSVTAAAQGLNINGQMGTGQQHQGFPTGQLNGGYAQPIITPIQGAQPGLYSIYDPATGQSSFYLDQNIGQQAQQGNFTPLRQDRRTSPPMPDTPRVEVSPPPPSNPVPLNFDRAISPPKSVSPPHAAVGLPPPSATAFRRGHKKATSLAFDTNVSVVEGPKTCVPKSTGMPATPMTGTFGPGQARAGDHPIRQPRGPPPLEELTAKPTAKIEGSKNFSTRRRRKAVHSLVRAGQERRGAQSTSSTGSTGASTPVSEEDPSTASTEVSLSAKRSFSALNALGHGTFGIERKDSWDRSRSREFPSKLADLRSGSTEDIPQITYKPIDAKPEMPERRKTPMLVLTSAEKRKSSVF
ncbi:MAG: hypothetical protein M1814_000756 [Vezdaea aestivalis]|nr:MAG: hypothetical protein M1814_000756 [Vezdaea aestivalis]